MQITLQQLIDAFGFPPQHFIKGAVQNLRAHQKCVAANKKRGRVYKGTFWLDRARHEIEQAGRMIG